MTTPPIEGQTSAIETSAPQPPIEQTKKDCFYNHSKVLQNHYYTPPETDYANPVEPLVVVEDKFQMAAPNEVVHLNATYSFDSDGEIVTTHWTQVYGPAVEIEGANTLECSFRAPDAEGVLVFEVTVIDNDGLEKTTSVIVETKAQEQGEGSNTGNGIRLNNATTDIPATAQSPFSQGLATLEKMFMALREILLAFMANLFGLQGGGDENPSETTKTIAANEKAVVWGDPHFIDPDDTENATNPTGKSFDFQGVAGQWYQLIEDKGINLIAHFAKQQADAETVEGDKNIIDSTRFGLMDLDGRTHEIRFEKNGTAVHVDPENIEHPIVEGEVDRIGENKFTFRDGMLIIETNEYKITQSSTRGGYIRAEVETTDQGVNQDGQKPIGLIGDLFDEDSMIHSDFDPDKVHPYDFDELFKFLCTVKS